MSRNKYPEETRQRILEVSLQLFLEKGYEQTSLNDILARLGGLTKGAIYHHFKSKEDILIAVVNQIAEQNVNGTSAIMNDSSLNGSEKIQAMYSMSIQVSDQETLFSLTPNLLDNPVFLATYIKKIYTDLIPHFILPVIQEGIKDGSIKTKYPDELAELILLLTDIWMNPLVFSMTPEQIIRKGLLFNELLKPFGLEPLTSESLEYFKKFKIDN